MKEEWTLEKEVDINKEKTAHWIVMYECSRCGEIVVKRPRDICPFCKAKMLNVKEK